MKQPRPTEPACRHRARLEHRALVVVESAQFAFDLFACWSWTIARGETPNVFTIAFEASRIANRVLLLNVSRAAAVLEIIDPLLPHVLVLNATKINPHVRELMDEERTGVEKLVTVKLLPLVSPGPGLVALFGQRVRRRGETEDVKNQRFVVALPTILDESAFRSPTMRYCVSPDFAPIASPRVGRWRRQACESRARLQCRD